MEYKEIMDSLKAGEYKPVYFLHGAEAYFMDSIADYIERHLLEESQKAFNQTVLYGRDLPSAQPLIDAARRYPMMAERQLIILREAQELKDLATLSKYVEQPMDSTVLVILHKHKRLDLRSGLAKALKKSPKVVLFESKKLYDNQIAGWIEQEVRRRGLLILPEAAELMAEYLGTDLSRIAGELEKLALNLPKGKTIDQAAIERYVGISREYNPFELQKALARGEREKVWRIVEYFRANPRTAPMQLVVASLYGFYSKLLKFLALRQMSERDLLQALGLRSTYFLREYREAARRYGRRDVERAIALLQEYDLKSKGVGFNSSAPGAQGELLRELVWKLLFVRHLV
ncbi:MAG TPA: DNA polymerase III subunit delta [Phaeodactylibacter sp.]|nr:DNA polymerase III subunit delta [Phaeodactylibacter sp.]